LNYTVVTPVKTVERFLGPKLAILKHFGNAKWLNTKFERNSGAARFFGFFQKLPKIIVMFFTTAILKLLVASLLRTYLLEKSAQRPTAQIPIKSLFSLR